MANTKLKRAARARQRSTGERYTTALARVKEGIPMSTNEEQVYEAVEKWLKERGYRTIRSKEKLLFSRDSTINEFRLWGEAEEDDVHASVTYMGFGAQSSPAPVLVPCAWSELVDIEDVRGTIDLIIFVLETKFPSFEPAHTDTVPMASPAAMAAHQAELAGLNEQIRVATERARNAEDRIASLTGEGTPKLEGVVTTEAEALNVWSTFNFSPSMVISNLVARFFYTPLGQEGQGFSRMTMPDTNLREAGRIPGGLSFHVRKVMVELMGLPEDVEKIRRNASLSFDFTQTVHSLGPISLIVPPSQTAGAITLGKGIVFPEHATFSMPMTFGPSGQLQKDTWVRITLSGRYTSSTSKCFLIDTDPGETVTLEVG